MKKTTKTIAFLLALVMTLATMLQITLPAAAATPSASDYVKVTKHDNYNKDGKYWMKFTIDNLSPKDELLDGLIGGLLIQTSLFNSSGKQVNYWKDQSLAAGASNWWEFGINFSQLPSGTYTFVLKIGVFTPDVEFLYWDWKYSITYTAPEGSFSYNSYQAWYDDSGYYRHGIKMQTKNMKGHKLSYKIYNEYGDIVCTFTGKEIKTNDETQ